MQMQVQWPYKLSANSFYHYTSTYLSEKEVTLNLAVDDVFKILCNKTKDAHVIWIIYDIKIGPL